MNYTPTLRTRYHHVLQRAAGLVPVALAFFATNVSGQTPAASAGSTSAAAKDDPIRLEAFVSTGTRFNDRTVVQSPVPIDIITSADLHQGGQVIGKTDELGWNVVED